MSIQLRAWVADLVKQGTPQLLISKQIGEKYHPSGHVYHEAHRYLRELGEIKRKEDEEKEIEERAKTRKEHRVKVDRFFELFVVSGAEAALKFLTEEFDEYHRRVITEMAEKIDPENCEYTEDELQPIRDAIEDAFNNSDCTEEGAQEWLLSHCEQMGKGQIMYSFPGLWEEVMEHCKVIHENSGF